MPPPSFVHGRVQVNIAFALESFLRAQSHPPGRITVESGLITERDLDTVRGPDVAFWSFARLPADQTPEVYADVPADLVVEVVSPGNTRKRVAKKLREYFASGVRLVWVVDPEERTATVYTKPGEGTVMWEDAVLSGGDAMPGFTCPVSEFFRGVP